MDAAAIQKAVEDAIYELVRANRRRHESGYDADGHRVKEGLEDASELLSKNGPLEGESGAAYVARLQSLFEKRRSEIMAADRDDWASVAFGGVLRALEKLQN